MVGRRTTRPMLWLATAGTLAACSPPGTPRDPAAADNSALDAEVAAVINIQDRTEIQMLKERVVTLEREVGALKANPQTLDLDLLTQRVERLEVGAATGAPAPAAPAEAPRTSPDDPARAQRAVDAAISERRARREGRD